uniref:BTB domain-containing protein n=1 Tax=Nyssomyia neivai TaxID=330878 RepID=A0A1L8DML4_9DIPT
MAAEHTFFGTWEIMECSISGTADSLGLKGVKFRLDEMGDITWYSDVVHPPDGGLAANEERDTEFVAIRNEFTEILFSCETFEVVELLSNGPGLTFGAYAGHNIEFKTTTFTPMDMMVLNCEGWCFLSCRRMREDQTIVQDCPFSLLPALQEGYFADVIIKSSESLYFETHSAVLRLTGFDCSMNYPNQGSPLPVTDSPTATPKATQDVTNTKGPTSHYLLPPSNILSAKSMSGSFNCLTVSVSSPRESLLALHNQQSSSDTDLRLASPKEIFTFSGAFPLTPTESPVNRRACPSPRFRCSSPFSPSCLDTPPTSPLTPISVLYNLPHTMLVPIFHWLYSESLPANLKEDVCEELMKFAEVTAPLNKMVDACRKYGRNVRLKKFIVNLTMDIHTSLNRIIQSINPHTISRHPEVLCSVFKHSVKETAIGFAKILQFCNIFVKDATNITRQQRHEIIKFARSRMPIFVSQIHQLLKNIYEVLSRMTPEKRNELATFLVPHIEITFDQMTNLFGDIKISLEKMYQDLKSVQSGPQGTDVQRGQAQERNSQQSEIGCQGHGGTFHNKYSGSENDLTFVLYMYELRKMRDIYGRVQSVMEIVQQNRNTFVEMATDEKERTIRRNLDQLILELPSYIGRIEKLSDNLDGNIGWKEFKFCFKLATGQVNGIISKLLEHKTALKTPLVRICELVGREEFRQAMVELHLIGDDVGVRASDGDFEKNHQIDYSGIKLNLTRHICNPPAIVNSTLSKSALRLLHSSHLSDMEFEVIVPSGGCQQMQNKVDRLAKTTVHVFKAHRVIVAARCEWFRKALLSGMKEDIHRKITIHDTSPVIFRRLLLYLYGAPIDKTVGAEQLCELMLLADRYSIDELKDICEHTLRSQIDEESVILLLSISDRFNTAILKANCLSFISSHSHVTHLDIFAELPESLQNEVIELLQWCDRTPEPWNHNLDINGMVVTNPENSRKSPQQFM